MAAKKSAEHKASVDEQTSGQRVVRDGQRTKRNILLAAIKEFAQHGLGGARVDRIADLAGSNKAMIYSHYGSKDELYIAALRQVYIDIRSRERTLNISHMAPKDAMRTLVEFTLRHFVANPEFIRMLNTENLHGGTYIRQIDDIGELQSPLLEQIGRVLESGKMMGIFKATISTADLYITIASLAYFPISNRYTLSEVFSVDVLDDDWFAAHEKRIGDMVILFLMNDEAI